MEGWGKVDFRSRLIQLSFKARSSKLFVLFFFFLLVDELIGFLFVKESIRPELLLIFFFFFREIIAEDLLEGIHLCLRSMSFLYLWKDQKMQCKTNNRIYVFTDLFQN